MDQGAVLYKLQQIELQILSQKQRLEEIKALLDDNHAVQVAKAALENAQAVLKPLQQKQRDLELQMQATLDKQKATEARLYSGSVTNPKELQDMQDELTALKKRESDLEDQTLELMDQVETAQAQLENAQAEYDAVMATWENEHIELLEEQEALQKAITEGLENRRTVLKSVDKAALNRYNALRSRKGNQPVAVVQGNSCSACGIELTLAVMTDVRREQQLVNCPNCERILVILHGD